MLEQVVLSLVAMFAGVGLTVLARQAIAVL